MRVIRRRLQQGSGEEEGGEGEEEEEEEGEEEAVKRKPYPLYYDTLLLPLPLLLQLHHVLPFLPTSPTSF